MQDANDFYRITIDYTIKNYMAADVKFAISSFDFTTVFSLERIAGQLLKARIQQG